MEYHNPDRKPRIVLKCSLALSDPPSLLKRKSAMYFFSPSLAPPTRRIEVHMYYGDSSGAPKLEVIYPAGDSPSLISLRVSPHGATTVTGGGRVSAGNLLDYFQ